MTNLVYLKTQNGIWFDFKIEPMDDEILLEKAVEELSMESLLGIFLICLR
jgi:hypothetical protein